MKRLVMLALLCAPILANAADINLSWVAPDQYEDGSPLPLAEIKNFRFEYTIDGVRQPDLIAPNSATTLTVSTNARGSHCFVGFTVSIDGLESVASVEQPCKAIAKGRPKPPRSIKAL